MDDREADTPILDLLSAMTALSLESSALSRREVMLVRVAALVASDASPASYTLNLGAAGDLELRADEIRAVFGAVAPVVGTARVATAMANVVKAHALEELAEFDADPSETEPAA